MNFRIALRNGLRVWMTPESAHGNGHIGCWHFQWLRFVRFLRSFPWIRSVS